MEILLAYDVDKKHIQIKAKLIAKGYADFIMGSNGKTNLPNTTLYNNKVTIQTALNDLKQVVASENAYLERAIAVTFSDWTGIFGEPHSY